MAPGFVFPSSFSASSISFSISLFPQIALTLFSPKQPFHFYTFSPSIPHILIWVLIKILHFSLLCSFSYMHTRCLISSEKNYLKFDKMEGGFVQHRPKIVGSLSNKVINKKKVKKRSSLKSDNVLQKLYGCCKRVFKGPGVVPSSHDVQSLCSILDGMKPEDLGLSKDLPFFNPRNHVKGNPRVTCTTIYRCQNFSLVLFFLPTSAVIPLHNHPEMTVFSKLLLGTMHIKAYDWADSLNSQSDEQRTPSKLAKLKANSVFTAPCNTTVLYPTSGGNIHAFMAITPCAVLDVLGPPYSKEDGRDCTYYKDSPCTFSGGELSEVKDRDDEQSYGWLEEIDEPKQSKMVAIPYLGPIIDDTAN